MSSDGLSEEIEKLTSTGALSDIFRNRSTGNLGATQLSEDHSGTTGIQSDGPAGGNSGTVPPASVDLLEALPTIISTSSPDRRSGMATGGNHSRVRKGRVVSSDPQRQDAYANPVPTTTSSSEPTPMVPGMTTSSNQDLWQQPQWGDQPPFQQDPLSPSSGASSWPFNSSQRQQAFPQVTNPGNNPPEDGVMHSPLIQQPNASPHGGTRGHRVSSSRGRSQNLRPRSKTPHSSSSPVSSSFRGSFDIGDYRWPVDPVETIAVALGFALTSPKLPQAMRSQYHYSSILIATRRFLEPWRAESQERLMERCLQNLHTLIDNAITIQYCEVSEKLPTFAKVVMSAFRSRKFTMDGTRRILLVIRCLSASPGLQVDFNACSLRGILPNTNYHIRPISLIHVLNDTYRAVSFNFIDRLYPRAVEMYPLNQTRVFTPEAFAESYRNAKYLFIIVTPLSQVAEASYLSV